MDLNKVVFLLASVYFWLLFGGIGDTLSCDLKKSFENPIFRQFTAIISIFLLFVIIDKNDAGAYEIWKNTLILYVFYLLLTKSKWYFSIIIIILVLIDQTLFSENKYLSNKNITNNSNNSNNNSNNSNNSNNNLKLIEKYDTYRKYIQYVIIFLIIFGSIHYFLRQKNKFGKNFDMFKFLFDVTCKKDRINFKSFT